MGSPRAVFPGHPDSLEGALAAARNHQLAGKFDKARMIYEQVLRVAPNYPEALTMLASIGYQLGDDAGGAARLDAAIKTYRRIVLKDAGAHAARAALANLLLARDRRDEAEAIIGKVVLPLQPVRSEAAEFEARRRTAIDRKLPAILINALPKSASESIWNDVAEGLGLGQAHVSIGLFPDCLAVPHRLRELGRGGVAAKEHLPATTFNLAALAASGVDRVIIQLRDPRQSTLSWAHFLESDVRTRLLAPIWRKTTPPAGFFDRDFATQLDWHIDHYLPITVDFVTGWLEAAADRTNGVTVQFMTFEDYKRDAAGYLASLVEFYDIDAASFADDAKAEVIHLRKGATDEWRGVMTEQQRHRAWRLLSGPLADRFGWTE